MKSTIFVLSAVLLLVLAACTPASAPVVAPPVEENITVEEIVNETLTGTAIAADELELSNGETVHLFCLREISGTWSDLGKEHLQELVEGKEIRLEPHDAKGEVDDNEYLVYADDVYLNEQMLADGYAEMPRANELLSRECARLDFVEAEAHLTGAGHWDFEAECSVNFYSCSTFASKEQAQQVMEKCGPDDIHNLDDDDDGLACERLNQWR